MLQACSPRSRACFGQLVVKATPMRRTPGRLHKFWEDSVSRSRILTSFPAARQEATCTEISAWQPKLVDNWSSRNGPFSEVVSDRNVSRRHLHPHRISLCCALLGLTLCWCILVLRSGWWSLNIITAACLRNTLPTPSFRPCRPSAQVSVEALNPKPYAPWGGSARRVAKETLRAALRSCSRSPIQPIQAELPFFVAELPEGKRLGNLIAVCTQVGAWPITYSL